MRFHVLIFVFSFRAQKINLVLGLGGAVGATGGGRSGGRLSMTRQVDEDEI